MGRYSFGREHRIRYSRDFQRIYRQGKLLQDDLFRIFYCRSQDGVPRLGLSVGKGLGKAVVRNRVKRAIREAFRLNKELFAGFEIIVQPKPPAARLPGKEIQERFLALARRLPRSAEDCVSQADLL